ncbi:hypothetical protein NRS6120_05320 [Bacillus subtilis]|nr:TetR/AcrR family transcriptional regulator C-terminal domain-containing protein [Bacillus subtilis]CAF1791654.1 hypothetical protein NRS6120_03990 [Bacillus subtilis]CAI6243121.1 hypothetical protein NRS6120_05320 [Bacillus subtilis]
MQDSYMKQDIEDAFLELSKEEAFDKITVTQIVKKCGISRQTFYYHFKDAMEVAEAALIMLIETTGEKAKNCTDERDSITTFVTCMQEHKSIFKNMYYSKQKDQLISYMLANLENILMNMPVMHQENQMMDKKKFAHYIDFYSYGLLGILIKKIVDADTPTVEITNEIYEILSFNMKMYNISETISTH